MNYIVFANKLVLLMHYFTAKQVKNAVNGLILKNVKNWGYQFFFNLQYLYRYSNDLLCDLIKRYEEPNDKNRWDQPLFTICIETENLNISDVIY